MPQLIHKVPLETTLYEMALCRILLQWASQSLNIFGRRISLKAPRLIILGSASTDRERRTTLHEMALCGKLDFCRSPILVVCKGFHGHSLVMRQKIIKEWMIFFTLYAHTWVSTVRIPMQVQIR